MPPSNRRAPWTAVLARWVPLALLMSAGGLPAAPAAADEPSWKPVVCTSPRPYRGPRLHPPPGREVFEEAAAPFGAGLDSATVLRLERAFEKAMEATRAPSMTAAVGVPGRGLWTATRSSRDGGGSVPDRFWFASAGKVYTAAVVLQLVEERRLSLDSRLIRWFPDYPNAAAITIEHLLTHTSGIYSFQEDSALRAKPGYHDPDELIAVARSHGNAFCPGEYWSYCNTGYVMLGRIVEQIERRPFHEVLTARLIGPLGLEHTVALAPRERPADVAGPHPAASSAAPIEDSIPTTPFAAGNIVSTGADMVAFWHALLGGRVLGRETVRDQFRRLYPMFDGGTYYGKGVMLYDVPDRDGRRLTWLGHSGGAPGFKAVVAYSVEANAFVAVALDNDGSAEAAANLLLRALSPEP